MCTALVIISAVIGLIALATAALFVFAAVVARLRGAAVNGAEEYGAEEGADR